MKLFLVILILCGAHFNIAFAIDPGTAQGSLCVDGADTPLRHAYAHLHDNAEKLLDRPKELRILLADREVPQDALIGISFTGLEEIARDGRVRGLLLQLDPYNRKLVVITVLYAQPDSKQMPQMSGTTDSAVVKKLTIAGNRVSGEIGHTHSDTAAYAVRFSAPLFSEPPVTADLVGRAAYNSQQVRVLRKKARALAQGDFEAVRRLSTRRANRWHDAFIAEAGAEAGSFGRDAAAGLEKSLARLRRVVVRGEHAVAIFAEKKWMLLERESGEWRSDDQWDKWIQIPDHNKHTGSVSRNQKPRSPLVLFDARDFYLFILWEVACGWKPGTL